MKRFLSLAAALAMAASLTAPAARAATPQTGTLTADSGPVAWTGSFPAGATTPLPEGCNVPGTCDEFDLSVGTGGAPFWTSHNASLQIGIQWKDVDPAHNLPESDGEYNTIDLYVYGPDGQMVASSVTPVQSSMGIASTAQVVNVNTAADGVYRVLAVPFNISTDVAFHGLAMVQPNTPDHLPTGDRIPAAGELLPDLISLQPTNFRFEIGADSLAKVSTDSSSCYAEEIAQDGAQPGATTRCLRFDAGHANIGSGPFYLDVNLGTAQPTTYQNLPTLGGTVNQIIEHADGTETSRPAGDFYFHIAHGHIHYKNFARYDLVAVDAPPLTAGMTVESKKSDFCMIDVDDLWFGQQGAQPRTRHFPQCNALDVNRLQQQQQLVQRQGIDRGWADWYTWDLPGQYIDFTSMPDGVYDVVNTVNPIGAITESNPDNDRVFTRIRVSGSTVTCINVPGAPCPLGTTSGT